MSNKRELELQIEEIRSKMYEAFKKNQNYEDVLNLSKQLDELLNQLDKMNR